MIRYILIINLMIFSFSSCNQKLVKTQTKYPNGQIESEGTTLNGQPHGLWKFYHDDGSMKSETYFENGKRHGESTRWYKNGQIEGKGTYKDGIVEGTWYAYYDNGNYQKVFTVIKGQMHGEYTEYYYNGQIKRQGKLENGIEIGEWLTYFETGELKSKTIPSELKGKGYMTIYNQNGKKLREGSYINETKEDSIWTYYDEYEKIMRQAEYKNGEFIREVYEFLEPNSRLNNGQEHKEIREPLKTVEQACKFVQDNFSNKEETLWISDELNDPMGMNMAIIADGILKAGYIPNGFDQKDGYRIYKYNKE